ncbi:hypothetical protein [Paenibacillus pinihumi]|uniref:hypothetical protein n=1 Tax=Paenibacillus pinihumi TaxID=669462 RepID=UPI0004267193|nr:hypothetical protein [Paenibacillus pinihumi]
MYERLEEKLKTTSALKWFPNHGAEESWITEVEEELRLHTDGGWFITEMPG